MYVALLLMFTLHFLTFVPLFALAPNLYPRPIDSFYSLYSHQPIRYQLYSCVYASNNAILTESLTMAERSESRCLFHRTVQYRECNKRKADIQIREAMEEEAHNEMIVMTP